MGTVAPLPLTPGRLLLGRLGAMLRRNPQNKRGTLGAVLCKEAQPFLLPPNGDFGLSGARTVAIGEMRAPYPVTALEFEVTSPGVAACVVFIDDRPGASGKSPGLAITEWSLYDDGRWGTGDEVAIIPPGVSVKLNDEEYQYVPGYFPASLDGNEVVTDRLWGYTHRIVADFLCLLSCTNVTVSDASVPRATLERAAAKSRSPFVVYKILDLPNDNAASESSAGGGVAHVKRFHYRRGHVRRLQSGRNTWVRSCAVGDPSRGLVVKDYRMHSGE